MSKLGEIGWADERALLGLQPQLPNWDSILEAANKSLSYPDGFPEQEVSLDKDACQEADEIMKEICQKLHDENVVFVQYAGGMKYGRGMGLEERQVVESIVRPIIEKLVDERDSARILHAHDNTFSHAVKRAKEAEEHAEQLQARVDDLERERAILID